MLATLRQRISGKKRAQHLGKYQMEMVKRVPTTTTRITDDVPRMPKRANFFVRARHGDLGPKMQKEVGRFVPKHPLSKVLRKIINSQLPNHRGTPNPEKAPIPDDLQERANHIKALAYFMGADVVGICKVPEYAWYSHQVDGTPIEPLHKYAIVMLCDQGFETTSAASGDDWISNSQSMRGYLRGSIAATTLTNYLLELGQEAQAHTNRDSDVLHVPLIMQAGLGELSRIGEVVLNPFLGPRFKSSVVTTNLDLAIDLPIDFNLQNFCNSCMKCARECPVSAIPWGDKVMFNGYEMWKPDVEACTKYRVQNPAGAGCGRCLKVCHFSKEGLMQHRWALWLAINVTASHKFLIWLDDALGYGSQVRERRWWWDLVMSKGKYIKPKKTNDRQLRPERVAPERAKNVTFYGINEAPPPHSPGAVPIRPKRQRKTK